MFVTLLLLLLLANSKSLNFLRLKYVRKICSLKVTLSLRSTYHLAESEVSQIFFQNKMQQFCFNVGFRRSFKGVATCKKVKKKLKKEED